MAKLGLLIHMREEATPSLERIRELVAACQGTGDSGAS
jgi:hypothetical protein